MDFSSKLKEVEHLLSKEEYTASATRSMIMIEQALRQMVNLYMGRVDEEFKRKVQEAIRKRDRRGKGIDGLTMGHLVNVLYESQFLKTLTQVSEKDFTSLQIIDLNKLTQLRNKLVHEVQAADRTEAEFLLHCLQMILETFDITNLEADQVSSAFMDSHALIIGVGADLPDTITDAIGLAEILRDPARCAYPYNQVTLLTDKQATREAILATLDTLAQTTNEDSIVIIYFSGHSCKVNSVTGEEYYLMPYDYDPQSLARTAISSTELIKKLKAISAKNLLILLDCAYAGGFSNTSPLLSGRKGWVLIASSQADEVSFAGKPYSVFTQALLEALCGQGVATQDGYVRVADLALYVREVVPSRTNGRQHPILHFEYVTNFVLAYYAGGNTQAKGSPISESYEKSNNFTISEDSAFLATQPDFPVNEQPSADTREPQDFSRIPTEQQIASPSLDYSEILKQKEQEYAQQAVDRFVRRFDESYRKLVYFAALPLVLTPELVNYLRNQFLREEDVPWTAEVDLLLSDLCREVGYELYALDTAVRAYALSKMREEVGVKRMQNVARLLINYVQQLSRTNPYVGKHELQAQQWAAMAYLDDKREDAVREIVESFRNSVASADATVQGVASMADRAEMMRLSRLVQTLSPELEQYPEIVEYAEVVTKLLTDPDGLRSEQVYREWEVSGERLPGLESLIQDRKQVEVTEQKPEQQEQPREWTDPVTGMEFVWIPPGRFWMGQTEKEKEYLIKEVGENRYYEKVVSGYINELPRHDVQIAEGFWMGKYPVTQKQWLEVMGENPSRFDEKNVGEEWRNHPVEQVSWDDVQEFLKKLNEKVGNTLQTSFDRLRTGSSRGEETQPYPLPGGEFRLSSEAEWEYACRAGAETMFCFGDDVEQLEEYAWYVKNSGNQTHPVGKLKPNAWGLNDMHGNVWEWCADPWHNGYWGAPSDGQVWKEEGDINFRLLRGGAWNLYPGDLRCACRSRINVNWDINVGFRLVRSGGAQ